MKSRSLSLDNLITLKFFLIFFTAIFLYQFSFALNITFTKIADTHTPVPDEPERQFAIISSPSRDGTNLVFRASIGYFTPNGNFKYSGDGIFTWLGGRLSKVVDQNSLIPNEHCSFGSFSLGGFY